MIKLKYRTIMRVRIEQALFLKIEIVSAPKNQIRESAKIIGREP